MADRDTNHSSEADNETPFTPLPSRATRRPIVQNPNVDVATGRIGGTTQQAVPTPRTASTASTVPYQPSAAQYRTRLANVGGGVTARVQHPGTPGIAERLASRMAARAATRESSAVREDPVGDSKPRSRASFLSQESRSETSSSVLSPMARSKLALKHMDDFEVSSSLLSRGGSARGGSARGGEPAKSSSRDAQRNSVFSSMNTTNRTPVPSAFATTMSSKPPPQPSGTSDTLQQHELRATKEEEIPSSHSGVDESTKVLHKEVEQRNNLLPNSNRKQSSASAVDEYLRVAAPRFGSFSVSENQPHRSNIHGLSDNPAFEAKLSQDPRVIKYGSKITLRSQFGTYMCVGRKQIEPVDVSHFGTTTDNVSRRPRTLSASSLSSLNGPGGVVYTHANGSPAERGSLFTIVSTQLRHGKRPVKFGDNVALCSTAADGRYLGAYAPSSESQDASHTTPSLELRQKTVGQSETWTVIQVANNSFERATEKLERISAEEQHLHQRAKDLGVSQRISIADHQHVSVSVRSSDAVVLRSCSRHAKGWVIAIQAGPWGKVSSVTSKEHHQSGLVLVPEQLNDRNQHAPSAVWNMVSYPSPFVPDWSRERPFMVGKSLGLQHSKREAARAEVSSLNRTRQQKLDNAMMSTDHVDDIEALNTMILPLHNISLEEQEELLVEDMLFAMQGIEGNYIRCRASTETDDGPRKQGVVSGGNVGDSVDDWDVDPRCGVDESLRVLANRMLPLGAHYVCVQQFVECRTRYEHGSVSHALCAAIRTLVDEYDVLVAQLEHQHRSSKLSMHKLWFYVQPSLRTLEVLSTVSKTVGLACSGGKLLNSLHAVASQSGNSKSDAIYQHLIRHACEPYLSMLELWVYHGTIRDPYQEFMVRVDEDTTKKTLNDDFNARYWDSRYTIRGSSDTTLQEALQHTKGAASFGPQAPFAMEPDSKKVVENDQVPFFLKRVAPSVLTTGKYLNVIRECGRWISPPFAGRIRYSDEDYAYDQLVQQAHVWASTSLLDLLLGEEQLVARLRSIKHSFLLDQGDFFVHFMDVASEELARPVSSISLSRLQSLLEMCLRVRDANDQFQEDLTCELVPYTLIQHVEAIHEFATGDVASDLVQVISDVFTLDGGQQGAAAGGASVAASTLTGFDAFTLDFKVQWPLSLVLSRQSLTKYQLIFRHLFFCKHVERQLCNTWQSHQTTKELSLRSSLGPDYCLRQRMLHFLQNYEYYIMFEVLEPRWHELEHKLKEVRTVDELMRHHAEFLDTCLRECLLTHQGLLKTLAKLMTTCLLFAEQVGRFADQLKVDEESMVKAIREADPTCMPESSDKKEVRRQTSTLRRTRIKVQSDHIKGIFLQQSYRQMIIRSQNTFDEMLRSFMGSLLAEAAHGEFHSHLSNLCTRLDFNSYYQQTSGSQE